MQWATKRAEAIARSWRTLVLVALAYVPVLAARPGVVTADTKTYLYLDPGEVLSEATSMWSSAVGAGTVTHQYIGYLWPMGPWFWLMETLAVPDWMAQRLWWGTIVCLAALGTYRLSLRLGHRPDAALLAALAYGLSPYLLHYVARLSGLLLPWAALPWIIFCVVRARGSSGWRWPAVAVLVIGTAGTVNATALAMSLLTLVAWMVADVLAGHVDRRRALATFAGIASGSIAVSLWWLAALAVQSAHGLPILRYTETYEAVAKASLPQELLRGLGYWFFYGGEYGGRWIGGSAPFMQNRIVIVAGFVVACAGLVAVALNRSRERIHAGLVLLLGLTVAVGAAPLGRSGPWGRVFERIVSQESGFALRSTPRAMPGVLLVLALSLGWVATEWRTLTSGLHGRLGSVASRTRHVAAAALVGVVLLNNLPWFTGSLVTDAISRDEHLPLEWTRVADAIDAVALTDGSSRTYEFPAVNFADHRWGGTVDPVLPGLLSSGHLAKEMVPLGSEPATDLLSAFESRLVEVRDYPALLAQFAVLLSADTLTWRADLLSANYLTARPENLAASLAARPPGPLLYAGPALSSDDNAGIVDETWYSLARTAGYPSVTAWQVPGARPMLTLTRASDTVVVAGSGDGVIEALAAGALSGSDTFLYAGSLGSARHVLAADGIISRLVATDSNRRAARHWSSVVSQVGRTETRDETPSRDDPSDIRLNPFTAVSGAAVPVDEQSVSVLVGDVARIRASSYGNPITFSPEDRPENAIDGDPRTAWRGAVFADARGQWLEVSYRRPVTTDRIDLYMPVRGRRDRVVTLARLDLLDDSGQVVRSLPVSPGMAPLVSLRFPSTTFSMARYELLDDSMAGQSDYSFAPGVGLAEISVPGVANTEYVVLPRSVRDLSARARTMSIVLARWTNALTATSDPEVAVHRIVDLAAPRTFMLSGAARLAGAASEEVLQRVTSLGGASSSARLVDTPRSFAALAVDGDPATAWTTPLRDVLGARLDVRLSPGSPDALLRVRVRNDRWHSRPERLALTDSADRVHSVTLRGEGELLTADIPDGFRFPLVSVRIDRITPRTFTNRFTSADDVLPVAFAEIDLGTDNTRRVPRVDPGCRDDLVRVNGGFVPVRLVVSGDPVSSLSDIAVVGCEPVTLRAGENTIDTVPGLDSGIDIDRVLLSDDPAAASVSAAWTPVTITSFDDTRITALIDADGPRLLSFAQNINTGWRARLETNSGRDIDLGEPVVVQGYANGWIVPEGGRLVIEWTPQRLIGPALWTSALATLFVALLALGAVGRRRRAVSRPVRAASRRQLIVAGTLLATLGGGWPALVGALLGARLRRTPLVAIVTVAWVVVAAVIVVSQSRFGHQPTLDWPGRFADLSPLAWFAVGAAGVAALASATE